VWIGIDPTLSIERLFGTMYLAGSWTVATALSDTTEVVIGSDINVMISDSGEITATWISYNPSLQQNQVRALYSPLFGSWGVSTTTLGM
jgi:hypothetical protein